MALVDLRGIHFRAYLPQWDQNIEDGTYDPVSPGNADITPGGIDLSIIKFRAWQQNDLDSDIPSGGDGGGATGDGSGPGGQGSSPIIWPNSEILNSHTPNESNVGTIRIRESTIESTTGSRNTTTNTPSIAETINSPNIEDILRNSGSSSNATISDATSEATRNSALASQSMSETISSGGVDYGDGVYGDGDYPG